MRNSHRRLCVETLESRMAPASLWINVSGGNWNDPLNWENGVLPGVDDEVVIEGLNPGAIVVHSAAVADAVKNIHSDAPIVVSGGVLSMSDSSEFTQLTVSGGVLVATSELKVTDAFYWTGGTIRGIVSGISDTGVILAKGTTQISGPGQKTLDGMEISNFGLTVFAGGTVQSMNGASFINDSQGTFRYETDASFEPRFVNEGAFIKAQSFGLADMSEFTNLAQVTLETGTLRVGMYEQERGATFLRGGALASPNAIEIGEDGSLYGPGNIDADLINRGVVSPGAFGALTITGNYVQDENGVLTVQLSGETPQTDFGQLVVTGNAAFDGTLRITVSGGLVIDADDVFVVAQFSSGLGRFASVIQPTSAVTVIPVYNATNLTLRAHSSVPGPTPEDESREEEQAERNSVINGLEKTEEAMAKQILEQGDGGDLGSASALEDVVGLTNTASQVPLNGLASSQTSVPSGGGGQSLAAGGAIAPTTSIGPHKVAGIDKVGDAIEETIFDKLPSILDDLELPMTTDALTSADIARSLLIGTELRPQMMQGDSRIAPIATLLPGDMDTVPAEAIAREQNGLIDLMMNPVDVPPSLESPAQGPVAPANASPDRHLSSNATPSVEVNPFACAAVAAILIAAVRSNKKPARPAPKPHMP